jgi:hypothetical protein
VHLCDSGTVTSIDEEHTRSYHVTKRRAGLAKRFVDDLEAALSLHADVGVYPIRGRPRGSGAVARSAKRHACSIVDVGVYMAVRPDRGSCGNEDETLVADSPAKADLRLQRRA